MKALPFLRPLVSPLWLVGLLALPLAAKPAKNVILLISDGAGFNTFNAASYYQYGQLGRQPYEQPQWAKLGCSTYPLNLSSTPTGSTAQLAELVYQPQRAWETTSAATIQGGGTGSFAAYNWLKTTYTDSAAAGTALSAGVKTYNNAMNWANQPGSGTTGGAPLMHQTLAEVFKAAGKAVGIVTTVQWSHATPAAMLAHNVSRNNYADIANEMLNSPAVDVLMGAGHPDFSDNNVALATPTNAQYVGGTATWGQLKAGTHPGKWRLVQSKGEFEALATGNPTGRVLGVAQVATTLQQVRGAPGGSGYAGTDGKEAAFAVPLNAGVPTLETMTKGALNVLDAQANGFFLMVEGGAVDWANHANQGGRMIEEQIDFNRSVQAVVNWVEANSSWEETLVIVTADHECGMLWGPNSATKAFDPIVNNGAGQMPGMAFNSGNHTNMLVPVYARGVGQELLVKQATLSDPMYGLYVDNTHLATAMKAAGGISGAKRNTRFVNVSARERIGSGEDVAILGFVVDGPDDHAMVITARGPSLAGFGVNQPLANPLIVLRDQSGREVARNDDWSTDAHAAQASRQLGFSLQTRESALVRTLAPGMYTVTLMSADNQSGVSLIEIFSLE